MISLACISGDLKKPAAELCRLLHQVMTNERYMDASERAMVRDYIHTAYNALVDAYEYVDKLCDTQH